jgi:uncharacterized protein YxjI
VTDDYLMKQKLFSWSDDFTIKDEASRRRARV